MTNLQLHFLKTSTQAYAALLLFLLIALSVLMLDGRNYMDSDNADGAFDSAAYLTCYYSFNSTDLTPELINIHLCTHIIAAFAGIDINGSMALSVSEDDRKVLSRVINVTSKSSTKVMISIGGKGIFGSMVKNHASRKKFIRSLITFIKEFHLDGVDIDWEWPVIDGGKRQKVQFIQLLQEIRTELDRHEKKYELSAAVGAPESIVSAAYFVQHMAEHVDFINLMCYDYHMFMPLLPATDYNAPLYADPADKGSVFETLNDNYTVNLWLSLGMPAEKIVLGMPLYGHSYRLRTPANHGRHAPAESFGSGSDGFVSYTEVCQFIHSNIFTTVVRDSASMVPYAYYHTNWISYDDATSLQEKVKFAKSMGLKGAMVWSLNNDDYSGSCSSVTFPLLRAIHSELFKNST